MNSSANCHCFFYFKYNGSAWFLVNVFICTFLDFTHRCHNYCHGDSLKVPHFLNFFPGLCLNLLYSVLICHYLLALTYQLEGIFFFYNFNHSLWSFTFYFSVILDRKTWWLIVSLSSIIGSDCCLIIIILPLLSLSHRPYLVVFHWRLSHNMSFRSLGVFCVF